MRFAYARDGGPLLNWSGPTPPSPTRAGETRSLGAWYPTDATSNALRRYGGVSAGHGGAARHYQDDRALGAWYATNRTSSALRRYGGRSIGHPGAAQTYRNDRALGTLGNAKPALKSLGGFLPIPGAPEMIDGYESPEPGAATIHLGLGSYIPEGQARNYGQGLTYENLGDSATVLSWVNDPLVRKAAILASAYHGVRRHNGSLLWGLIWGLAAWVAPINGLSAVGVAVAQGFGRGVVTTTSFVTNPGKRRRRRKTRGRRRMRRNGGIAYLSPPRLPAGSGERPAVVVLKRKRRKR